MFAHKCTPTVGPNPPANFSSQVMQVKCSLLKAQPLSASACNSFCILELCCIISSRHVSHCFKDCFSRGVVADFTRESMDFGGASFMEGASDGEIEVQHRAKKASVRVWRLFCLGGGCDSGEECTGSSVIFRRKMGK